MGTRIHLARPGDAAATDALMTTTGDEVRILPVLREAIENGTAGSAILTGLGAGAEKFHNAATHSFSEHSLGGEALSTVCLVLVATDEHDQTVGVLTATAPDPLIQMATTNGYTPQKATALSVFVAKIHGIAVAEHARRQGIARVPRVQRCVRASRLTARLSATPTLRRPRPVLERVI
ncbi:hypothetical protein ACF08M_38130 [Streptomyces sp. NPDC015032]|uniref:hypothetical protein n=1 Tax=Streptomyces sp. NPDC015032 TaxID=3364937 RepID=UPI0036F638C2